MAEPTYPRVWDSPSPYVVLTPAESEDLQDQLRRWRESGYDPDLFPSVRAEPPP